MPYVVFRPKSQPDQIVAAHHKVVTNICEFRGEMRDGVPVMSKRRAAHIKRHMGWQEMKQVNADEIDAEFQEPNIPGGGSEEGSLTPEELMQGWDYEALQKQAKKLRDQGAPQINVNSKKEDLIEYICNYA